MRMIQRAAFLGAALAGLVPSSDAAAQPCATGWLPASTGACIVSASQAQFWKPSSPGGTAWRTINGVPTPASCPDVHDNRVLDLVIRSPSLQNAVPALSGTMRVRVLLPTGWVYTAPPAQPTWPTLYLLHGYGAMYQAWTCSTFVKQDVSNAPVLVVMPDGTADYNDDPATADPPDALAIGNGHPSFYSNWVGSNGPSNPNGPQFEVFYAQELTELLELNFGADPNKKARAGLSMGGGGSIYLTAKHPQGVVAAASFSGLLNPEDAAAVMAIRLGVSGAGNHSDWLWGPGPNPFDPNNEWAKHNPIKLAAALQAVPLYFSAGNGFTNSGFDAVESLTNQYTKDLIAAIGPNNAGIDADHIDRQGSHTWPYWDIAICNALKDVLLPELLSVSAPYPINCPALPPP